MEKNIIAFWGYPKKELIEKYKKLYPNASWIDLDIDYGYPNIKFTPDAYCTIIKNICNNAFYLKEKIIAILAPIGKDKCDSAYFVAEILKEQGFDIKIIASVRGEVSKSTDRNPAVRPLLRFMPLRRHRSKEASRR